MWSYHLSPRHWKLGREGTQGRAGFHVGEELVMEEVAYSGEGLTLGTVSWLVKAGRVGPGAQVILWREGLAATQGPPLGEQTWGKGEVHI